MFAYDKHSSLFCFGLATEVRKFRDVATLSKALTSSTVSFSYLPMLSWYLREKFYLNFFLPNLEGRHDNQQNDIQHNDTQHNDIQHNDTQHNDIQHNGIICDTEHERLSA